jgi:hypothetical protein
LALDEPNANEVATLVNDIDVLISDEVKGYADRSKIDYISEPYQEGFTIGAATDTCC